MTNTNCNIDELDLLAYADGLLDADPTHKAAVEAYLAEWPDTAERIAIYARQNDEIRRRYDFKLAEPPPARLAAVLAAERPGKRAGVARIAAMVALLLATGAAGWVLGEFRGRENDVATGAFVEMAVADYRAAIDGVDPGGPVAVASDPVGASPEQISRQVEITLPAPDLSAQGYRLIDEAVVAAPQGLRAVRYLYTTQNGDRVGLFMQPRLQARTPSVRLGEVDGTHVAYWSDGPIRYGLVADRGEPELSALAAQLIATHRNTPDGPGAPTLKTTPVEPLTLSAEPTVDGMDRTSAAPVLAPRPQAPAVPVANSATP